MDPRSKSGKRQQSKRVITARREMRYSHLLHEYDEDDHNWAREKKQNVLNSHPSTLLAHNHGYKHAKLKNRKANNTDLDYY